MEIWSLQLTSFHSYLHLAARLGTISEEIVIYEWKQESEKKKYACSHAFNQEKKKDSRKNNNRQEKIKKTRSRQRFLGREYIFLAVTDWVLLFFLNESMFSFLSFFNLTFSWSKRVLFFSWYLSFINSHLITTKKSCGFSIQNL